MTNKICPVCGEGHLVEREQETRITYKGLETTIFVPGQWCDACDDGILGPEGLRVRDVARLVNALIHADYSGRVSLLVVKRPDLFGFRNPGTMRMPVEIALKGGVSDCRNRRLQDMFRFVGLGEQAGSGIPKVRSAWSSQHWRAPELAEQVEPFEQTIFTLRMASLLPDSTVRELEQRFGSTFHRATEVQKLALVTAAVEGRVTHSRLIGMLDVHPRDVTVGLSSLVQRGLLESRGEHKRTYYVLPGAPADAEAFEFNASILNRSADSSDVNSVHSDSSSVRNGVSSVHSDSSSVRDELIRIAQPLQERRRAAPEVVEGIILELCRGRFLSLEDLAELTGRTSETLRIRYLSRMVSDGKLRLRYPERPTHPQQAYTSADAPERAP